MNFGKLVGTSKVSWEISLPPLPWLMPGYLSLLTSSPTFSPLAVFYGGGVKQGIEPQRLANRGGNGRIFMLVLPGKQRFMGAEDHALPFNARAGGGSDRSGNRQFSGG